MQGDGTLSCGYRRRAVASVTRAAVVGGAWVGEAEGWSVTVVDAVMRAIVARPAKPHRPRVLPSSQPGLVVSGKTRRGGDLRQPISDQTGTAHGQSA